MWRSDSLYYVFISGSHSDCLEVIIVPVSHLRCVNILRETKLLFPSSASPPCSFLSLPSWIQLLSSPIINPPTGTNPVFKYSIIPSSGPVRFVQTVRMGNSCRPTICQRNENVIETSLRLADSYPFSETCKEES